MRRQHEKKAAAGAAGAKSKHNAIDPTDFFILNGNLVKKLIFSNTFIDF